ncbi:MAG TPA: BON domain-containing protein [Longimicrobium sp.]|nr:BON domain-containing protein [Longimicrobium sp.]
MKMPGELRTDVQDELAFEPSLDEAGIGVAVNDGVVTLTGHVKSYAEKRVAERAVKRVSGVHGVANDLVVNLWPAFRHDDTDVARAALHALRWNTWVPQDAVMVTVKDGWVTLEGSLPWQYQKLEAEKAVAHLQGVRGVTNGIAVQARVQPTQVERRVQSAFARAANLDARQVHVETSGGVVTLRGTVRSWAEHEDAERAAWSVAGVTAVRNDLEVVVEELATV